MQQQRAASCIHGLACRKLLECEIICSEVCSRLFDKAVFGRARLRQFQYLSPTLSMAAGVGWSSRGSKVCVTMLALQCQCCCRDETCVWGALSSYASCVLRLSMATSRVTRRKPQTPGTAEEHTKDRTYKQPYRPSTDTPHRPSTKHYRKGSPGDA